MNDYMAEVTIRINQRLLERIGFGVAILILAVLLFLKWDSGPAEPDVDVVEMQATIDDLTSQVETLEADLAEAENELELIQEAEEERAAATEESTEEEPEPEPEPELSGEIELSWITRMKKSDPDMLDYIAITIENGLDTTQKLSYRVYWENFFEDTVALEDNVVIKSGQAHNEVIFRDGQGVSDSLSVNIPENIDTLIFDVYDNDGDLVDELIEVVR